MRHKHDNSDCSDIGSLSTRAAGLKGTDQQTACWH
jgi:hypothetical protein